METDPQIWREAGRLLSDADDVSSDQPMAAISSAHPGPREMAVMLQPSAQPYLEQMASRARMLTAQHFGKTISLYAPLYLSNYCSGGCAYCGYASDRKQPRRKLSLDEVVTELSALKEMGFEEVLLLTGERTPEADFDYLCECVTQAAGYFHQVTIETFPMTTDEYIRLAEAGCVGVTLYQETYDPELYTQLHRWGPKKDYDARINAPARVLDAGIRNIGLGVLLGLSNPLADVMALYLHAEQLSKKYWRSGVAVSFPRIRPQKGGFVQNHIVDDHLLARMIFAFRICMPDVPLVLSTREAPAFRDGMAGLGISRMSVASRTTVGGYADETGSEAGQFEISDKRSIREFCDMLCEKGLEPVFKNWDGVYSG